MKLENITYSHEHMVIDLTRGKNDPDCYLNIYEEALDELKHLKKLGVVRIVDCSNHGMGVNWQINRKIQEETGIEIINSTGCYKDPFLPETFEKLSIEELAEIMIHDIENGAKIIGEIGTSKNMMTDNEKKLFQAAALAQKKTNAVIITHTTLGTWAKEQVDFFIQEGIDLKKVIISHVALANDYEMILDLVKKGVNVAFDTIGKLKYLEDSKRMEFIYRLCEAGYSDQILMSMDLTRQSHLRKNGGPGYGYLLEDFIPKLIEYGVKEKDIKKITSENFERILKI